MFNITLKGGMPPLPKDLLKLLKPTMQKTMFEAERISKKDYLSGPRPDKLGVVSTILRNSMKGTTKLYKTKLMGVLGTKTEYAPRHELGINIRKRPFIIPSLEDVMPFFKIAAEHKILKEWRK